MEIAPAALAGTVVNPQAGSAGTGHVLDGQQPRLVLVGGSATAAGAVGRVVLAGDGVAGSRPGRVLDRQPGLKHAGALNDGHGHEQEDGQDQRELGHGLTIAAAGSG